MSMIRRMSGGRRSNVYDPFSWENWDPLERFPSSSSSSPAFVNTQIDWKETSNSHIFKADLPGIKREEVKIEVEDGRILQISGERSREQEEESDKWHRIERSSGKFLRRFRLPENSKMEELNASMEDGVLTVTVLKMEEKKPEIKCIAISGSG